jgi:hypothetical protein
LDEPRGTEGKAAGGGRPVTETGEDEAGIGPAGATLRACERDPSVCAGGKISSKSFRSKSMGSAAGLNVGSASTFGTRTCPAQVGQRTTLPAFRAEMPNNWLQNGQRKRIGMSALDF